MKQILRLAWRNIGRNRRRSLLSALAVSFAVAVLVFSMSLQLGSYADMIFNTVHSRTGHLQVQHAGYWPDRELIRHLAGPDRIVRTVAPLAHVRAVAPRITSAALASSRDHSFGALVLGIDPDRERAVSTLADLVREGDYLAADDTEGALLGWQLARNLGLGVGDEVVFIGQGAYGSLAAAKLTVRGLVRTGMNEMDRMTLVAHLAAVQEAYSLSNAATEVAVLLEGDRYRAEAEAAIRDALAAAGVEDFEILAWPELMPGVEQSMKIDWYGGLILYVVLVFVVGFGIANTFLMAFLERIHELGVLLSLGMRPRLLAAMLYLESVFLTLLGVGIGLGIGVPLTYWFQVRGIDFGGSSDLMAQYGLSPIIHPRLSAPVFTWAIGIVTFVALLLAIYPAVKAARLQPVEALRRA